MQAAQVAVMHWATMAYMRQVGEWRGTEHQESAVTTATKLTRTFTGQMERLKHYRTGGEQKVTVQQVSVSKGKPLWGTSPGMHWRGLLIKRQLSPTRGNRQCRSSTNPSKCRFLSGVEKNGGRSSP